jgi:hypothetical protein
MTISLFILVLIVEVHSACSRFEEIKLELDESKQELAVIDDVLEHHRDLVRESTEKETTVNEYLATFYKRDWTVRRGPIPTPHKGEAKPLTNLIHDSLREAKQSDKSGFAAIDKTVERFLGSLGAPFISRVLKAVSLGERAAIEHRQSQIEKNENFALRERVSALTTDLRTAAEECLSELNSELAVTTQSIMEEEEKIQKVLIRANLIQTLAYELTEEMIQADSSGQDVEMPQGKFSFLFTDLFSSSAEEPELSDSISETLRCYITRHPGDGISTLSISGAMYNDFLRTRDSLLELFEPRLAQLVEQKETIENQISQVSTTVH